MISDRWRSAADGTKFQTAEIADDRDRIAFEVADLSRQLRDLTEKSRMDIHALQEQLQEKIVNENNMQSEMAKVAVVSSVFAVIFTGKSALE